MNMKGYETKTSIMKVLSSKLRIDTYQRPLDERRVCGIVREFNPDLVNYIKCSMRTDGELYIFDGQHTRAVLELQNGGLPIIVECRVYEFVGLSDSERYEVEAILFAKQNGLSKQVHLGSRLRAEYLAGEPKAIAFYDVSNASGLEMDFTKNVSRGKIVCIVEAYKAWEALGDKLYGDMLDIIVRAWNKQPESLHREIIGGMASFLKKHSDAYDPERLIKCLSKVSPIHIVREGNLLAVSGTAKYAEQIVKLYNKNMKKKLA